jgi:hypothetical protein
MPAFAEHPMHAFKIHPQKPAAPEPATTSGRKWRRWAAFLLLLLAVGGLVWAVRPDPHLARAQALQKELFGPDGKSLSREERKARFAEFRDQVKHLTDDQKWELGAPMREKQKASMDRYFAMAPAEKTSYLDGLIDRSEKMRQEWQKKGGKGDRAKGGPPANFAASGSKAGGAKGGRPRSPDEINQRRKQFLDRTTPEDRAKMDRFRKDMADRRKQRGLPMRG